MNVRCGPLAVVFHWYPVNTGFAIHKWRYKHESSWRHGAAYFWRLKVMW